MNNRFIVSNYIEPYNFTENEIKENDNKECCLVCSIIICFNLCFIGIAGYIIQNEDINGSMN